MKIAPDRFTLGRMMALVALLAVLLAAGLYRRDNSDANQAMIHADLQAIRWGDARARREAVESLGRAHALDRGQILTALVGVVVGDGDPGVRGVAVRSLGSVFCASIGGRQNPPTAREVEDDAPPVRAIIRALGDESGEVRRNAAQALADVQARAGHAPGLVTEASPALLRLLDDPDPTVRSLAVSNLSSLRKPAGDHRDRVVAMMEHDPDAQARAAAIGALIRGWAGPGLYPVLLDRWARAPSPEEKSTIAWSLGTLPAPPPASVPTLLAMMRSDPIAAQTAPEALFKLGPAARPHLGPIREVAGRELEEPGSPLWAAQVVARIDPDSPEAQSLLEPAARLLRDTDNSFVRQQVAVLISLYRGSAGSAVPTLRETLQSPSADARGRAAWLLARTGPAARAAADELAALGRRDPDPQVRAEALAAVRRINPR